MSEILSAIQLCAGYGPRMVLHELDFVLHEGERVLLAGPNGSGKSTLLKCLSGVLLIQRGTVSWKGQDIGRHPTDWRVRHGMGYLMQTRNVFVSLTVNENLHLAAGLSDPEFEVRRERALEIFPFLSERLDRRAGLLSGGERQALAVSMVLMRKPQMLLIDEPTAGLAPKAASAILDALHRVQTEEGFSLLIVEHNLKMLVPWVSRAVVMTRGRIVAEEDEPEKLLDHERLSQYYFG